MPYNLLTPVGTEDVAGPLVAPGLLVVGEEIGAAPALVLTLALGLISAAPALLLPLVNIPHVQLSRNRDRV